MIRSIWHPSTWLGIKEVSPQNFDIFTHNETKLISEAFKGYVERTIKSFPEELGEEHIVDMDLMETIYKKEGFVTGIVDKLIDFIIGPGFYVTCKDENAKKIINDFMRDMNFDTKLRSWLKEALVKGTGYFELSINSATKSIDNLKVINGKSMYINQDEYGEIEGYKQYTKDLAGKSWNLKKFDSEEVVPFETNEIACLVLNKIGDSPYGMGIIYPALQYLNDFRGLNKSMHRLSERKAGAPIHAKMGRIGNDPTQDVIPKGTDVSNFAKKMEYMTDRTEWATSAYVDMKVIDFGRVSENFKFGLQNDKELLFAAFQIPGVLMGMPEGTNRSTSETIVEVFKNGRVKSIQAEMEKVIEQQIFKPVLEANDMMVHVEFEWGMPSDKEKNDRADRLINALKVMGLSSAGMVILEKDLIDTMDLDVKEWEKLKDEMDAMDEERRKEEERKQPIVPGSNREEEKLNIAEKRNNQWQNSFKNNSEYAIINYWHDKIKREEIYKRKIIEEEENVR